MASNETEEAGRRVTVLGDVNYDTVLVPVPELHRDRGSKNAGLRYWPNEQNWLVFDRPSGAWFLRSLIELAVASDGQPLASVAAPPDAAAVTEATEPVTRKLQVLSYPELDPFDEDLVYKGLFLRSIVKLKLFPQSAGGKQRVYRIGEVLGWFDRRLVKDASEGRRSLYARLYEGLRQQLATDEGAKPGVVVVHDRANIFRDLEDVQQQAVDLFDRADAIVWQMFSPLASGRLWNAMEPASGHADKTVLVVKENCLRQFGVNVRQEGSLERTLKEFLTHLKRHSRLEQLAAGCRHLIVRFDRGVLHYDRAVDSLRIYVLPHAKDKSDLETNGAMAGYTSLLVATLTKAIVWSLAAGEAAFAAIEEGVKLGVVLAEQHYRNGFADEKLLDRFLETGEMKPPDAYQELFDQAAEVCQASDMEIATVELPKNFHNPLRWSRVHALWPSPRYESALDVAVEIVLRGLKEVVRRGADEVAPAPAAQTIPWAPRGAVVIPYAEYGKIQTCDQHEIDAFASIETLVREYLIHKRRERPLSFAVFGPPGSGKSFTVKQVLSRVAPAMVEAPLEFNLAQFNDLNDLAIAFHKVQDRASTGEAPLVVFDEFDSVFQGEPLGWLKYLLAPMQDGAFKHGESIYRIGRSVFVFSGGTSATFAEFSLRSSGDTGFRAAKGPDFVSRLRGYLDIVGIDGREHDNELVLIRRAVILRSLLLQHLKYIFDSDTETASIDKGVIYAFLEIDKYKHGVRSMEAIVEMAAVSRTRRTFQKSSIPSPAQLSMHVDAERFCNLLDRDINEPLLKSTSRAP